MITKIELTEEARATLKMLQELPVQALKAIAVAMDDQNKLTMAHVSQAYLSFPKGEPAVDIGLRVQSGRLRAALAADKSEISGSQVQTSIGDSVKYAAIHEFGGRIMHPARSGSVRLRTNAAGELLRQAGGRGAVFAKDTHKRVKEVAYQAESYVIEMPARAPVQRGISERLTDYGQAISDAVIEAMKK